MTNIFVRIIGEFKDKEFKRADKYTTKLDKNFNNLRRSATRAFIAVAGISALKRSVKAFAEEDAAVQKLTKSLDNLGLRFESGGIDEYLENLEKATTVTKEQLYPAFQQLANTTLSVSKSQQLLNSALDISAGTGKDLTLVVTALSRAFNNNFTSLGKLQTSYSTAQLEAMGFEKSVATLSSQFSGAAAASADTYQGKIARLNIALGDAQEAIGEGVIDALEALGGGNYEQGLELIARGGEKIGDAFRFAATGVAYFKKFWKQGLFATKDQLAEFRRDVSTMFTEDPAKQRTLMRERGKYLAAERKETEKIRRERERSLKLLEKEKNEQKLIAEASKKFDMERIQIEAALQGKLTQEERIRVELQKAILNENADKAAKLQAQLKAAQEDTKLLAESMSKFVASDPFAFWATYFDAQTKERDDLDTELKEFDANDPFSFWGTYWAFQKKERETLDTDLKSFDAKDPFGSWPDYWSKQKQERDDLDGAIKDIKADNPFTGYPNLFAAQKSATAELGKDLESLQAGDPFPGWDDYIAARIAGVQALKAELASLSAAQNTVALTTSSTSDGVTTTTTTQVGDQPALDLGGAPDYTSLGTLTGFEGLDLSGFDFLSQLSGLGGIGLGDMNVTVNVEGSLISQTDLIAGIMQGLYEIQNNGQIVVTKKTQIP
jgi:hypothetical protein